MENYYRKVIGAAKKFYPFLFYDSELRQDVEQEARICQICEIARPGVVLNKLARNNGYRRLRTSNKKSSWVSDLLPY